MLVRPAGPFVPPIVLRLEDTVVRALQRRVDYRYAPVGPDGVRDRPEDAGTQAADPSFGDTLRDLFDRDLGLEDLREFLEDHPWFTSRRAVPPPRSLQWLWDHEGDAAESPLAPVRSLSSYFLLRYWETPSADADPHGPPRVTRATLRELEALPGVDRAYFEAEATEATADPGFPWQGYLHGSHLVGSQSSGINASAVWPAFKGTGIRFTDLERGWRLTHADFPGGLTVLNGKDNVAQYEGHGTRALGTVLAIHDNGTGVAGVAPLATANGVLSYATLTTNAWGDPIEDHDLAAAIVDALDHLAAGDVLLLEVQAVKASSGWPLEIEPHWFDAIRLVAALGRVVIEPAGNGAGDLDTAYPYLDRGGIWDSGAILVSGCGYQPGLGGGEAVHLKYPDATHGSRIDCYAWSESVRTTIIPSTSADPDHGNWGGTSAAVPIIAGAALLTQQMYVAVLHTRASPMVLRHLLSSFGTPVTSALGVPPTHVMPDLALIQAALGALPDVYVRDSVYDDGFVPGTSVSQSPDIFVKSTQAADKDAAYGAGSPLENVVPGQSPVTAGATNYVYIRMLNRGAVDAAAVTATVFWGDASTLLTPSAWHLVGTTAPTDVPSGEVLTVADPIVWTPAAAEVPSTAHACFVAVLDHPADPRPLLLPDTVASTGSSITWATFLSYVRASNNVAWRNFDFVPPLGMPVAPPEPEEEVPEPPAAAEADGIFLEEPEAEFEVPHDPREWWSARDEMPFVVRTEELPSPLGVGRFEGRRRHECEFVLRSFEGARHSYALEIIRALPEDSWLAWELPGEAALALGYGGVAPLQRFDLPGVVRLVLRGPRRATVAPVFGEAPQPAEAFRLVGPSLHRFPRVLLEPGAAYPCRFRVVVPHDAEGALVAVRQLHDGVEVGRVTFRLESAAEFEQRTALEVAATRTP